jgi:hypothetical protein
VIREWMAHQQMMGHLDPKEPLEIKDHKVTKAY